MRGEAASGRPTFDELIASEFERVLALALAMLRNEHDALEVAQETMTRALERWDDVGVLERPGAWCRRVALNLVADTLRSRTRVWKLTTRLAATSSVPANSAVELWEAAFWAEVGVLPQRQREVIVLHYVGDFSVTDIAEILGAAEGTVKSDLWRARNHLRARLVREEP